MDPAVEVAVLLAGTAVLAVVVAATAVLAVLVVVVVAAADLADLAVLAVEAVELVMVLSTLVAPAVLEAEEEGCQALCQTSPAPAALAWLF